ncbi:hypothetical protein HanRHA438_Chr03g0141701 [Helianthus annuus]|nr:hypothetical protein HanRHA438_Chr03g0141701 [Helianthus annuus]
MTLLYFTYVNGLGLELVNRISNARRYVARYSVTDGLRSSSFGSWA